MIGRISDVKYNELNINKIDGIKIYNNFLSEEEQDYLVYIIDNLEWDKRYNNLCQYYGFTNTHNFERLVKPVEITNPIPEDLNIGKKIGLDFNQLHIEEFKERKGKHPFKESSSFHEHVLFLPLYSDVVIYFKDNDKEDEEDNTSSKIPIYIKRGTLVVLSGDARFKYYRGITYKKTYSFNYRNLKRDRLILMTFRNIKKSKFEHLI